MFNPDAHISPLFLELRRVFTDGLMQAGLALGIDHANRTAKPWTYYAGVLAGATAVASGIPNASLVVYCAASALDILFFKSPEGGLVDVFIDGVAATNLTTFAANQIWENYQVSVNGTPERPSRVEFRTRPTDANGDPVSVNWFSVAGITPVDGTIVERAEFAESVPWQITITSRDASRRKRSTTFHYPYWASREQVEQYALALVDALQPVTAATFESVVVSRPLITNASAAPVARAAGRMVFTLDTPATTTSIVSFPSWREDYTIISRATGKRLPAFAPEVDAVRAILINARDAGHPSNSCDARGVVHRGIKKSAWRV